MAAPATRHVNTLYAHPLSPQAMYEARLSELERDIHERLKNTTDPGASDHLCMDLVERRGYILAEMKREGLKIPLQYQEPDYGHHHNT